MTLVLADRVLETSTTTGLGTFDLNGAEAGYQSFIDGVGAANQTYYCILSAGSQQWEVGVGTVVLGTSGAPNRLTRDSVYEGSSGKTVKVNFAIGAKEVFVTVPGSKLAFFDPSSGATFTSATVTGTMTVGGAVTLGSTSVNTSLLITGPANNSRYVAFRTGTHPTGTTRWLLGINNVGETGSDAGSNLFVQAYTDAGVTIDAPISATRAAGGTLTLARPTALNAARFPFRNVGAGEVALTAAGSYGATVAGAYTNGASNNIANYLFYRAVNAVWMDAGDGSGYGFYTQGPFARGVVDVMAAATGFGVGTLAADQPLRTQFLYQMFKAPQWGALSVPTRITTAAGATWMFGVDDSNQFVAAGGLTAEGPTHKLGTGTDTTTTVLIGAGGGSPTTNRAISLILDSPHSASFGGGAQLLYRRNNAVVWQTGFTASSGGAKTSSDDYHFFNGTAFVAALSQAGRLRLSGGLDFAVDNSVNIGAAGANRPSNVYVANSVYTNTLFMGTNNWPAVFGQTASLHPGSTGFGVAVYDGNTDVTYGRAIDRPSSDYKRTLVAEFKQQAALGFPGGAPLYMGLLTAGAYTDVSGGSTVGQLGWQGQILAWRSAAVGAAWSTWQKLFLLQSDDTAVFPKQLAVGGATAVAGALIAAQGTHPGNSATLYGMQSAVTFPSTTTTEGTALRVQVMTAAAFTLGNAIGIRVAATGKGAGSTITAQYGIFVEDQSNASLSNYALYTNAGAIRFGDRTGVGSAPSTATMLHVSGTHFGSATTLYGTLSQPTFPAATTTGEAGRFGVITAAAAFTLTNAYGVRVGDAVLGAGSAIATQIGLIVDDQTKGASNYAIYTGLGQVRFGDALTVATSALNDLTIAGAPTSIRQLALGNSSVWSTIGTRYSGGDVVIANNASQNASGADSWSQSLGTNESLLLKLQGASGLNLYYAGTSKASGTLAAFWGNPIFQVDKTGRTTIAGSLWFYNDNTTDIGFSISANRPRSIYVGTGVTIGTTSGITGMLQIGASGGTLNAMAWGISGATNNPRVGVSTDETTQATTFNFTYSTGKHDLVLQHGNVSKWRFTGPNFHFVPEVDNNINIGSSTGRIATLYAGTGLAVGSGVAPSTNYSIIAGSTTTAHYGVRVINASDDPAAYALVQVNAGGAATASGHLGAYHDASSNATLANRIALVSNSDAGGLALWTGGASTDVLFAPAGTARWRLAQHLTPEQDNSNDIGSTTNRVRILYAGTASVGQVTVASAAGTVRDVYFLTGTSPRWTLRANSDAETGSNAGSSFQLVARDDAGTIIDTPFAVTRAAGGGMLLGRPVTVSGKLTTLASATTGAGLNLPHGAAPTTPANGDVWTTTTGVFARVNGATVQLNGAGSADASTLTGTTLASNVVTSSLTSVGTLSSLAVGGAATLTRAAATDTTIMQYVGAEANPRAVINAAGRLAWGAGGATTGQDVTLQRAAAGTLEISGGGDASTTLNVGIGGSAPTAVRTVSLVLNAPHGASGTGIAQVLFQRAGAVMWGTGINTALAGAKTSVDDFFFSTATQYLAALNTSGRLRLSGGLDFTTDNAVDIGATAANRPRHLYLGGSLNVAGQSFLSAAVETVTTVSNTAATADGTWFMGIGSGVQLAHGMLGIGIGSSLTAANTALRLMAGQVLIGNPTTAILTPAGAVPLNIRPGIPTATGGSGIVISTNGPGNIAQASGAATALSAGLVFAPTSGTGTYTGVALTDTINQTGGASGITRGLHIAPTLTAAADHRALEVGDVGTHYAIRTGTGLVQFGGALIIAGSAANPAATARYIAGGGGTTNIELNAPTGGSLIQRVNGTAVVTVAGSLVTLAKPLTITGGTVTTSAPLWDLTQTWNAGAVAFTGAKLNVTDTASAAASLLLDLQVGATSKFSVRKDGQATAASAVVTGTLSVGGRNVGGSVVSTSAPSGTAPDGTVWYQV